MATFPSFFFVLGGSKPYNVCVSLIIVLTATPISPTAKSPDEDTSPKPTIFLPSNAERKLHKAGTYLCLLEDFFPDVIKIDWKEKNGRVILKSQQGDTMKTKDTYMKYTWLTVREDSMGKEHKCIVKHEKNKGGVDQEILFPSINTADLVTGSKVGFQKETETSRNTRPVTVSPSSTLSTSPFSSAAGEFLIALGFLSRAGHLGLAHLSGAQLKWQKDLPGAKPLTHQTTAPQVETSVSLQENCW
uniref:Ig-like domain-containing protein n=1 Tax=Panthera leo TaxID=9689 RepID=A0A8C8XKL2_PANLE